MSIAIAWAVVAHYPIGRLAFAEPAAGRATVLDRYRQLFERAGLAGTERMLLWEVLPKAAGLQVAEGTDPQKVGEIRQYLLSHQDVITDAISLSVERMEAIPTPPPIDEDDPDAHMRRPAAWIVNVQRLIIADAHRAWSDGQAQQAAERVIAAWNIGAESVLNANPAGRVTLALPQCLPLSQAMMGAGMLDRITPDSVDRWLRAVRRIDPTDPLGYVDTWRWQTEQKVVALKQECEHEDAGERVARLYEQWGINETGLGSVGDEHPDLEESTDLLGKTAAFKSKAEVVRAMKPDQLRERIEAAGAMIPDIDRAMRSRQPMESLKPLLHKVTADPTHIARLVVGDSGMSTMATVQARKILDEIESKLTARVP